MEFINYNIKTKEYKKIKYPRFDMKPVKGLNSDFEIYIIRNNKPTFDNKTQYLIESGLTLTDEFDTEFKHLKIAYRNFTINDIVVGEDEFTLLKEAVSILCKPENIRSTEENTKLNEISGKINPVKEILNINLKI